MPATWMRSPAIAAWANAGNSRTSDVTIRVQEGIAECCQVAIRWLAVRRRLAPVDRVGVDERAAGVGRQAALSVERDDDLALGLALFDVRDRVEGLVEAEGAVDDRAQRAVVVQGGERCAAVRRRRA